MRHRDGGWPRGIGSGWVTVVAVCTWAYPAQLSAQAEWEKVLRAARQEGRVAIAGAPGEEFRTALAVGFEKAHPEIKVEYVGLSGRDVVPRILQEHKIGKNPWDIYLAGATSALSAFKPLGVFFQPLRPALIRPEVFDDKKWSGGFDSGFLDQAKKYIYAFDGTASKPIYVNWDAVSPQELRTPEDLLEPKFSGKIVWDDPRTHGPGVNAAQLFLLGYGEDFLKRLFSQQKIVYTRDGRQLVEWVVQSRYPIGISLRVEILVDFQKAGVGKNVKPLPDDRYPMQSLIPGFGAVAVMAQSPHVNAARAYLNWLLSPEGQKSWISVTTRNSRRVDVPLGDPGLGPQAGVKYINTMTEETLPSRERSMELATKLIGG